MLAGIHSYIVITPNLAGHVLKHLRGEPPDTGTRSPWDPRPAARRRHLRELRATCRGTPTAVTRRDL